MHNLILREKVLKLVWILEAKSENGCKKWRVLVWNRVRIWRTGRHISHQEFPGVLSLPPPPSYLRSRVVFIVSAKYKSSFLSAIYAGYPWYFRINWYTGSAGRPGQHGPQGREGAKGQIGDKECRVQEETEGSKDPLWRVDLEELREWKVNRDFWEWKDSEALWEIQQEKEKKERKEKAPKQVKQV